MSGFDLEGVSVYTQTHMPAINLDSKRVRCVMDMRCTSGFFAFYVSYVKNPQTQSHQCRLISIERVIWSMCAIGHVVRYDDAVRC